MFPPRRHLRGKGSALEKAHHEPSFRRTLTKFQQSTRARSIASRVAVLLCIAIAVSLDAQTIPASVTSQRFSPAYDAAHEITIAGTLQQVITRHETGSPAGMHLLVAGPQGLVDAHVGPFLSEQTKSALHSGVPVQVLGAMLLLHGKDYLLARQLTVGGRTVTVRSEHGLLVRERVPGESRRERVRKSDKQAQTGSGL